MKRSFLAMAVIVALVLCFSFGTTAEMITGPQFSDVDEDAWYAQMVNEFSAQSIINGYEDGAFRPDCNVTRAEFAIMLFKYIDGMSISTEDTMTIVFSDVNEDAWYYEAVMTLANYGVINGYPNGTFWPDKEITREEIAYILYKFVGPLGIREEAAPEDAYIFYPDVLADRWSADAINFLTYYRVVHGYPNGTFGPENNATRAEAVAFLYMFFRGPEN